MRCGVQAHAQVTLKGGSDKAAAAELADKEQTILELRETNEVRCWCIYFPLPAVPRAANTTQHTDKSHRSHHMHVIICVCEKFHSWCNQTGRNCCCAADHRDKGQEAGTAGAAEGCKDPNLDL